MGLKPTCRLLALTLVCCGTLVVGGFAAEPATSPEPEGELLRGPYLQLGTPTSVRVRWRTANASESWVRCGPDPARLTAQFGSAAPTVDHEVLLSGLQPDTRYCYQLMSGGRVLADGPDCVFVTAPLGPKSTRVWVTSDMQAPHAATLEAYRRFAPERAPDLWLAAGDNGGDSNTAYQTNLFGTYASLLRQCVLWSCPGNHDTPLGAYYWDLFSLPTQGEAGGVPSGTESYYSFDYGNLHVVAMNSITEDRSTNGPMYQWLARDLQANRRDWLIAFWHVPPYTKGTYDSDLEREGTEMRENFLPLLEGHGVDLVLCGDNHIYERSYLIDSHYSFSTNLVPARMIKNGGDGRWDGSGPYCKPSTGPAPHQGTVYAKVTSAYTYDFPTNAHPVMYHTEKTIGSLVVDIVGQTLEAAFLRDDGEIADRFTLLKGVTEAPPRIARCQAAEGRFELSWYAVPSRTYRVERSLDLGLTWTPATPDLLAERSLLNWTEAAGTNTSAVLYRVIVAKRP